MHHGERLDIDKEAEKIVARKIDTSNRAAYCESFGIQNIGIFNDEDNRFICYDFELENEYDSPYKLRLNISAKIGPDHKGTIKYGHDDQELISDIIVKLNALFRSSKNYLIIPQFKYYNYLGCEWRDVKNINNIVGNGISSLKKLSDPDAQNILEELYIKEEEWAIYDSETSRYLGPDLPLLRKMKEVFKSLNQFKILKGQNTLAKNIEEIDFGNYTLLKETLISVISSCIQKIQKDPSLLDDMLLWVDDFIDCISALEASSRFSGQGQFTLFLPTINKDELDDPEKSRACQYVQDFVRMLEKVLVKHGYQPSKPNESDIPISSFISITKDRTARGEYIPAEDQRRKKLVEEAKKSAFVQFLQRPFLLEAEAKVSSNMSTQRTNAKRSVATLLVGQHSLFQPENVVKIHLIKHRPPGKVKLIKKGANVKRS